MADQQLKPTIRTLFKWFVLRYWLAWGIDHLSRIPVQVFDHPLSKELLPNAKRPVLHPVQCSSALLTAGQLVQKDAVRVCIKSLSKIWKSHIQRLPFTR